MLAEKPSFLKQLFFDTRKKLYTWSTYLGYKYNLNIYGKNFFIENKDEGTKNAVWLVPLLIRIFNFKNFLDVGCGTGHYLKACIDNGITDVYGIEGAPEAFNALLVDKKLVLQHDLREPLDLKRKYDLSLSIEVAEHIDGIYADNFVKILTHSSNVVLTASDHFGGLAHVNPQPQAYWIKKFEKFGCQFNKELTEQLKAGVIKAKQDGFWVADYLYPNFMVFKKIG